MAYLLFLEFVGTVKTELQDYGLEAFLKNVALQ